MKAVNKGKRALSMGMCAHPKGHWCKGWVGSPLGWKEGLSNVEARGQW